MSSTSSPRNQSPFGIVSMALVVVLLLANFAVARPVREGVRLGATPAPLVVGQPVITLIGRLTPVCDFPPGVVSFFPVRLTRASAGTMFQPLPYRMLTLTVLTPAGPRLQRCWTSVGGITRFLILLPPGIYPANLRYDGELGVPPVEMDLIIRLP